MLIGDLVKKNRVSFQHGFTDWEEAVRVACKPLLNEGAINDVYVKAIINNVKTYGPYIVIAPHIAMPHSQEGAEGVFETAVCFMKAEIPVHFEAGNSEKDAELFFVLASKDANQHIQNMEQLAMILNQPKIVDELLIAKNMEDLLCIDAMIESGNRNDI